LSHGFKLLLGTFRNFFYSTSRFSKEIVSNVIFELGKTVDLSNTEQNDIFFHISAKEQLKYFEAD
jgi:hypothetical protein